MEKNIPERISINALVSKSILEPNLKSILVEGPSDRWLVEWYLGLKSGNNPKVLEIDWVDVSAEKLKSQGLSSGNRSRLIVLSKTLAESSANPSILCIIDRDLDIIDNTNYENDYLVYTDYCCMEMFFANTDALERLFYTYFGKSTAFHFRWIENVFSICDQLFWIRAALNSLALPLSLPEIKKCCTARHDFLDFDEKLFIKKVVNKSSDTHIEKKIVETAKSLKLKNKLDYRNKINGHDFIETLSTFGNGVLKSQAFSRKEILGRLILSLGSREQLEKTNLFSRLDKLKSE